MDPATKRILFGDENQRLHRMHTRRLVTLDQELTDTEIKLFEARLALKDLLESNGDFQKRISSNQLRVAMLALQKKEESLFQRDFMDSLGAKHKATVQGWKNGGGRGEDEYVRHVNSVNSAEKKMRKLLFFVFELNTYEGILNAMIYDHQAIDNGAKLVMECLLTIKQLLISLQYDQDLIRGNNAHGRLNQARVELLWFQALLFQAPVPPPGEMLEALEKCSECAKDLIPVIDYLNLQMMALD